MPIIIMLIKKLIKGYRQARQGNILSLSHLEIELSEKLKNDTICRNGKFSKNGSDVFQLLD